MTAKMIKILANIIYFPLTFFEFLATVFVFLIFSPAYFTYKTFELFEWAKKNK